MEMAITVITATATRPANPTSRVEVIGSRPRPDELRASLRAGTTDCDMCWPLDIAIDRSGRRNITPFNYAGKQAVAVPHHSRPNTNRASTTVGTPHAAR